MFPAVEYPVTEEWQITPDFVLGPRMLEFRLVYQGLLYGSDAEHTHREHKDNIRQYLHKQLVKLWQIKEPLKSAAESTERIDDFSQGSLKTTSRTGLEIVADKHKIGDQRFIPIITRELALACALDVLILRRDHFPVINSGDLDNRIKTILDALRIPAPNEFRAGSANPLYVLLEDDKLVSELRVTADLLMAPPEQIVESPKIDIYGQETVKVNHAVCLIHVQVKPTRVMMGNISFV